MNRRFIAIGIIAGLLFTGWVIYTIYDQITGRSSVEFQYDAAAASSAVIYRGTDEDSPRNVTATDEVIKDSVEPGEQYSLEPGSYVIIFSGDDIDYNSKVFTIERSDKLVVPVKFQYSDSYLAGKLDSELDGINASLSNYSDIITSQYNASKCQLFFDGSWAACALVNKSATDKNRDTLKVVLQKSTTSWGVVTTPDIILSSEKYPDVPKEVIDEINIVDILEPLMKNYTFDDNSSIYVLLPAND